MRSTQLHSDKNFDNLGSYNNFGWRISFDKFPYLYYSTTYLYKLEWIEVFHKASNSSPNIDKPSRRTQI